MSKDIQVLIADDHPIFRRGLRMVIESAPGLKVVAEAADGTTALAIIEKLQPDVAILDINMPPPDGLAIALAIRDKGLPCEPVFLTMHKDAGLLNAALDLGVKGFVVKDGAASEVVGCIRAVAAGQVYLSPAVSGHLLARRQQSDRLQSLEPSLSDLTPSELRILRLVCESKGNKEIAEELCISVRTVEHHRSNICSKLGLTGKHALIIFALTHKSELRML